MAWQREKEFKQLLTANIRHLTKEGMDQLVSIAVKDMNTVRTTCLLGTYVQCPSDLKYKPQDTCTTSRHHDLPVPWLCGC